MNSEEYRYGDVIRQHRLELGLTQRQVAVQCGITDSALAHIEREMRLPSEPVATRIAEVLNLSDNVRAEFDQGLRKVRDHQARERIRSRAGVTPIMGSNRPNPEKLLKDIAQDFSRDARLPELYRDLRTALAKRNQRETVRRALKAWAADDWAGASQSSSKKPPLR